MIATIVNAAAIILGSLIGMAFKKSINDKLMDAVKSGISLVVLTIGMSSALGSSNTLCVVLCMVIGTFIGEAINIQKGLDTLGDSLRDRFAKGSGSFTEGFVNASLLFGIGAMAIMGSLDAGINHNYSTIYTKSAMDGVMAAMLSASLGVGVMFSALTILVYQGGITLLAGAVAPYLSQAVVTEMSAVGGVLILGIGLNMLLDRKLRLANMLPALFLPLIYVPIMNLFAA